ncbi:MAG: Eco57I restriction-modification methylase domain-containing protein, partial [Oscillospiraceae bacterium]|nr:Eco57I restriction-modification methylase domain-containing protein [Oscillospiraceae bacterium]
MVTDAGRIQNILESEFSMENYVTLIKEVLYSAKMVAPYKRQPERTNFSSHIENHSYVADYYTPDNKKLLILAVQLKKDAYVETSRSTQRSYAKKLIENNNADAALVAYYSGSDSKWRLSFVRLDYEMKIDNGRLKATENITPAKRYSFLVGKDEPSHTAKERLMDLVAHTDSKPTLDDIEESFSVEKVTKEFFELYCEKFHDLKDHLSGNDDFIAESEKCGFTAEQFAKKLMGQIVFLYFLQKKGWLGVNVWNQTNRVLDEKQYNKVYYSTYGVKGKLIKEYLPRIYTKMDDKYVCADLSTLDKIPDDAEEAIANCLPKDESNNWGNGSRKFLRTLFEFSKKKGCNFYNDYLEPLFYDTLNRNRGEWEYSTLLHCRVPFLSGGLFEPINGYDWKNSRLNIPDEIFSNKKDDNDRNADGILDIFDRYNFTMSEDEPMEREVAIDPEMLGKVFESLLEVDDRKSKGAFYTPREIVHYMCQESLISYLVGSTGLPEGDIRDLILYGDFMKDEDSVKTIHGVDENGKPCMKFDYNKEMYISENILSFKNDVNRLKELDDALKDIRVADPAVGSGAFPLGMMSEIVRARQTLTVYMAIVATRNAKSEAQAGYLRKDLYRSRSAYMLKQHTIKNSIFAVDIEPSAVDIAQLRLWLSLVIDDEINPNARNELEGHRNPLPLPNLECNILCGNSLVDEFEGVKLINQSTMLGNANGGEQFDFAQTQFEAAIPPLLKKQDELFYCDSPDKKKQLLAEISELKTAAIESQLNCISPEMRELYEQATEKASKPFILWQLEFARVFRDKGGFDVVIGNPPYIQLQKSCNDETGEKVGDQYQNLGFETYAKTGDIYCLFYEKGHSLLHKNGTLCFITSNKWMRAGYGKALRGFFAQNTNPLILIDFAGQKIFESATVDVNILMFTKSENKHNTTACIAQEKCKDNLSVFVRQNSASCSFNNEESWVILNPIEQSIRRKIEAVGTPLRDWNISINYGIKTGKNEAFIISGAKKDELIAQDPKSAEIIRPILRG